MNRKGFTLIEIVISLVVFSLVITAAITMYINSHNAKYRVDLLTEAQQSARIAIDYMIRDIRSAGYGIDLDESSGIAPQRKIVYAAPFELVFNANLQPKKDTPEDPQSPEALDPSVTPIPAHYTPSIQYSTGAETVVYTLDYNNDGNINSTDLTQMEPSITPNPNDYALIKRVYGFDSLSSSNGATNQIISVIGGPFENQPLFLYWYDNDDDPSTDPILWGDTNGDGEISSSEYATLTPITNTSILDAIEGVRINVTGVSRKSDKGKYLYSNMITDVAVTRNASIDVFTVVGHVYKDTNNNGDYDSGEPGLQDFIIRLNTGESAVSDANGLFTFALVPGTYALSCSPKIAYSATTDLSFDFTITGDMDFTTDATYKKYFGFRDTPTANIQGFVFNDKNGDGVWTSDEEWIPDVTISVWNNSTQTLNGDPTDSSYGTYDLEINAEESTYVWLTAPEGYSGSGIDTIIQGLVTSDPGADIIQIFDNISMGVYHAENTIRYAAFGLLEATGEKPFIRVTSPNGGEKFLLGEQNTISIVASGVDDNITNLMFYYSVDAGATWQHIGDAPYPIMIDDTIYNYTWIPSDTISGSNICYVKVGVTDEGNWTVYDQSDDYFTLVPSGGFKHFYFTNSDVDSVMDETMFLYSIGSSASDVLPKYLNTINSNTFGVGADSFNISGTYYGLPFYTQEGKYLQFVTDIDMPYADTLYPGKWYFYMWGWRDDDSTLTKYYDFEVHRRDSTGDTLTDTLLFSTLIPSTYDSLYHSIIYNEENEDTVIVTINHGFSINRSDRLYIKIFYSGSFSNTGGPSGSIDAHIQCHFGETKPSRIILPPKP